MKKLLTLLFAVALSLSLSSVSFAQDKPADSSTEKKADKKEKKAKKEKKEKKEKKDDMSKDKK